MKVWRVQFDGPWTGEQGYLVIDNGREPYLTADDGTERPEVTEYTTLDVDPVPPDWSVA